MLTLISLTNTDGTQMAPINAEAILETRPYPDDGTTMVDVVGSQFSIEVLETPTEIQTLANAQWARNRWEIDRLRGGNPPVAVLAAITTAERAVRDAVKQRFEGRQNTL